MNNMSPETWAQLYEGLVYESGKAALEIRRGKIKVDFSKITCPTLVMGCEKDAITPVNVARDISKKFQHYGYDFWTYPQFAHWIQVESGWETPAEDIFNWLNFTSTELELLQSLNF